MSDESIIKAVSTPSTIHTLNSKTVSKIELHPGTQLVYIHLKDGHILILEHDSNTHGLLWDLMEIE